MTRKLETLFDLPKESDNTDPDVNAFIEENKNLMVDIDQAIDKIDLALPTVRDLDTGDDELDELAKLATDKFNDLIDLGMNVEARFSGTILQTAGVLLGHAITAKTAKMDKKLRMINLQLQKAKLDYQIKKDSNTKDNTSQSFDGHAVVLDRNELLRQILAGSKDIKSIQ